MRITIPVLCLTLSLALAPLALKPETLSIDVENDAAPWSKADGTGYANDLVREAFKAAGLTVAFRVVPYDQCKARVVAGKTCACLSMSWLDEFSGRVEFSAKPLFSCNAGYFVKAGAKAPSTGVVGVVKGYEYPPSVYALKNSGKLRLIEGESEEMNLKKLAEGKLDAAIVNYNEIKTDAMIIARAGVKGKVRRLFNCGILDSHIGFSLKHFQGPQALEKFNLGFSAISTDGRLKAIQKKWSLVPADSFR